MVKTDTSKEMAGKRKGPHPLRKMVKTDTSKEMAGKRKGPLDILMEKKL